MIKNKKDDELNETEKVFLEKYLGNHEYEVRSNFIGLKARECFGEIDEIVAAIINGAEETKKVILETDFSENFESRITAYINGIKNYKKAFFSGSISIFNKGYKENKKINSKFDFEKHLNIIDLVFESMLYVYRQIQGQLKEFRELEIQISEDYSFTPKIVEDIYYFISFISNGVVKNDLLKYDVDQEKVIKDLPSNCEDGIRIPNFKSIYLGLLENVFAKMKLSSNRQRNAKGVLINTIKNSEDEIFSLEINLDKEREAFDLRKEEEKKRRIKEEEKMRRIKEEEMRRIEEEENSKKELKENNDDIDSEENLVITESEDDDGSEKVEDSFKEDFVIGEESSGENNDFGDSHDESTISELEEEYGENNEFNEKNENEEPDEEDDEEHDEEDDIYDDRNDIDNDDGERKISKVVIVDENPGSAMFFSQGSKLVNVDENKKETNEQDEQAIEYEGIPMSSVQKGLCEKIEETIGNLLENVTIAQKDIYKVANIKDENLIQEVKQFFLDEINHNLGTSEYVENALRFSFHLVFSRELPDDEEENESVCDDDYSADEDESESEKEEELFDDDAKNEKENSADESDDDSFEEDERKIFNDTKASIEKVYLTCKNLKNLIIVEAKENDLDLLFEAKKSPFDSLFFGKLGDIDSSLRTSLMLQLNILSCELGKKVPKVSLTEENDLEGGDVKRNKSDGKKRKIIQM